MIQGVETGDVWDSHGGMSSRCLCHHRSFHYFQVLLEILFHIIIFIVFNIMIMSYCTHCHHCSLHYFQIFVENIIIFVVINMCFSLPLLIWSSRWWWLLNWVRAIVMLLQMINDKHFFEVCFSTTWSKLPKI